MSLRIAARTSVYSVKVAILFLQERCWTKRVREQTRPLWELTRAVES